MKTPSRRSHTRILPRVLVIVGPTASGKTPLALVLARQLGGEIISADSRQVYRFMTIGTAKPTADQLRLVRHYFVDEYSPNEGFSAGEFGRQGRRIIEDIIERGKIPVVVGGSGLYIRALIDGLFEGPSRDPDMHRILTRRFEEEGGAALLAELREVDPAAAAGMLPSNGRRIIRALEVHYLTGIPISQHHKQQRPQETFQPVFVGLDCERKILYERINARVERMISDGLIEEGKSLRLMGYDRGLNALASVGYQEVFDYLDGKVTESEMVESIKRNSRRFAKRQLTWFRRDSRIRWFLVRSEEDFPAVASGILEYFRSVDSRR